MGRVAWRGILLSFLTTVAADAHFEYGAATPSQGGAVPPTELATEATLPKARRNAKSAELVDVDKLPLHTLGRYIVDVDHVRVKWACINWAGAYTSTGVVGGMQVQPLRNISRRISELGFNCVRLPYSTQGYVENSTPHYANLAANPELKGLTFIEIFDRVVESLTSEGLMVIINNHLSVSGWCCNPNQDDGYWYVPQYNETMWINTLTGLARRYKSNKLVVAFDLRNEPHDNPQGIVTWGDKNPKTDWAAAAERAGNAVLAENSDVLIVVSALCFCIDLRGLMSYQIKLMYPNRVVYEVHNYSFSQIATLLTSMFGVSWVHMEHIFLTTAAVFFILGFLIHKAWKWLGEPLPPRGVFRATIGIWLAISCVIAAIVFGAISQEQSLRGCNLYGREAFTPLSYMSLLVGIVCAAFGAWGLNTFVSQPEIDDQNHEDGIDGMTSSPETELVWQRRRAGRVEPGFTSSRLAWDRIRNPNWHEHVDKRPHHKWDQGLCVGLQLLFMSVILTIVFTLGAIGAALGDSYAYLQWTYDWKFGFALQEGYPYTAPVWLGEFGSDVRGRYWMHLISYASVRDLDFAYWPLDGLKLTEGIFDQNGVWITYDTPRWEEETYGMLNADYRTVRHPWKLLDLQAIMASPAGWSADDYPCDREVVGNACGG